MVSRGNDIHFLLFLLLILLALLPGVAKGIRQKYRPRPPKTLTLSRRQIENIVYRKMLFRQILFCIPVPLLMLLLYLVGRMGAGAAIVSSLVVLIVPAWNLYVLLYLQWRPLRSVSDEFWLRLEREMSREILQRLDGGWQFSNWSWYIRVSNYECALLRAELIDFEKPVQYRPIALWSMGFKHTARIHSHEYIFTGKDGSIIRARIEQTPFFTNWVKKHGGRFE